jgi:hypothetical protein
MKQRIQLEFSVVMVVDVDTTRDSSTGARPVQNPLTYAAQFADLSPCIHGNHQFVKDGAIASRLTIVDTEVSPKNSHVLFTN